MLEIITLDETEKWDRIVGFFNNADIYYLSGYVKAFKIHGDGEPLLFYFSNLSTKAINVVMKRDISEFSPFKGKIQPCKYYDLSTPYGYGGWIIEGGDTKLLFKEYESWCRQNSIVSEFVRFHPIIENHKLCESFYDVVEHGKTVSINLSCKDDVWNNFSKKNRNVIRKAINNDVNIFNGFSNDLLNSFIEIYTATMNKNLASQYYYFEKEHYHSFFESLKDKVTIFYAKKNNTIIAASIIMVYKGKMSYHLSGSFREFCDLCPTNLLLWQTCCWGIDQGCSTFHLGGGVGGSEDSLFKFKKAFSKDNPNPFYLGKKIFLKDIYDELVSLRTDLKDELFFPLYRG